MQEILCQVHNTSLNHVIYMNTQLQGDGETQLSICILLINWALLWATVAALKVESPLSHRSLLSWSPTGMLGAICEHPSGINNAAAQLIHRNPTSQLQTNSFQNWVCL